MASLTIRRSTTTDATVRHASRCDIKHRARGTKRSPGKDKRPTDGQPRKLPFFVANSGNNPQDSLCDSLNQFSQRIFVVYVALAQFLSLWALRPFVVAADRDSKVPFAAYADYGQSVLRRRYQCCR